MKICQYFLLHLKIICWCFHIKISFIFWDMSTWICEKFVYEHSKIIEYNKKLAYFLRHLQISRANNLRILRIKNAKFPGYCFYTNTNIYGDFQICISVPLKFKQDLISRPVNKICKNADVQQLILNISSIFVAGINV